jgi:hypothetical protein
MSQKAPKRAKAAPVPQPFERQLRPSVGDGKSANFALEYEALHAVTEQSESGRWFALLVILQHLRIKDASGQSFVRSHGADTPPDLIREVLEMIIESQRKLTLAELLGREHRLVKIENLEDKISHGIPYLTIRLRQAVPRISETEQGCTLFLMPPNPNVYEDGTFSFTLIQSFQHNVDVSWKISVDLKQVVLDVETCKSHRTKQLEIPSAAVAVETNVREKMQDERVRAILNLTPARVAEIERFNFRARFEVNGQYIAFSPVDPEHAHGALGFKIKIVCPWIEGKLLREHGGIKLGDRVRLDDAFAMYKPWAVGQEAVVREIRMFKYCVYYVELFDAALVQRVQRVHTDGKGLQLGQREDHLACRRCQIQLC